MTDATTTTQVESVTYSPATAVDDIAKLRDKVAETMPGIIPELLKGDSIASLISSIDESRALFERFQALEPKPAEETPAVDPPAETAPAVPGGGNTFTENLDQLPTMELIRRGLAQRSK